MDQRRLRRGPSDIIGYEADLLVAQCTSKLHGLKIVLSNPLGLVETVEAPLDFFGSSFVFGARADAGLH